MLKYSSRVIELSWHLLSVCVCVCNKILDNALYLGYYIYL